MKDLWCECCVQKVKKVRNLVLHPDVDVEDDLSSLVLENDDLAPWVCAGCQAALWHGRFKSIQQYVHFKGMEQVQKLSRDPIYTDMAMALLGRAGGMMKSKKKARASRENGKLGGRPKKGRT